VLFKDYTDGKIDQIHLCTSVFINTMTQKPIVTQLVPIKDNADEIAAQLGIPTAEWLKGVVYEARRRPGKAIGLPLRAERAADHRPLAAAGVRVGAVPGGRGAHRCENSAGWWR